MRICKPAARLMSALAGGLACAMSAGSAVAAPIAVGVWKMDETFNAEMIDSSGFANHGTTVDVGTAADEGYLFNGTSSIALIPHSPTLNPGTRDFTFTVQVQTTAVPGTGKDYDLLRKGVSATSGGEFKVEIVNVGGVGKPLCLVKDSKGKSLTLIGTANVSDGKLHKIICGKTRSGITLQVDSQAVKSLSGSLGSVGNTAGVTIGAKSLTGTGSSNDWYKGIFRRANIRIDEGS